MSWETARKWLRFEIPRRLGMRLSITGMKAGTATAPRNRPVQSREGTAGRTQAATTIKNVQGAARLRRRLSTIFQRPCAGM